MRVRVSARVYFISLSLQRPPSSPSSLLPSFLPSLFLWLLHLLRVLAVRTLVTSSLMFNGPLPRRKDRRMNERAESEGGREGEQETEQASERPPFHYLQDN